MAEEEKPLAEFHGVRHKKQDGVLLITSARVAWSQGDTLQSFQLNYPYQQIKAQRISPETSSKIQLQLVLRASNSQINFHFTGPDALADRNKVIGNHCNDKWFMQTRVHVPMHQLEPQ